MPGESTSSFGSASMRLPVRGRAESVNSPTKKARSPASQDGVPVLDRPLIPIRSISNSALCQQANAEYFGFGGRAATLDHQLYNIVP